MPMNEIQAARYNAILHKLLAMKEGAPSPLLAPEVFPTLNLEPGLPEWQWLAGVQLGAFKASRAATPGELSYIYMVNPANSGVIAVLETLQLQIATTYVVLNLAPSPAVTDQGNQRDARAGLWPTSVLSTIGFTPGSAVAIPGARVTTLYMNRGEEYPWNFILTPGTALVAGLTSANVTLEMAYTWRERAMDPSESR